jgi:hypothetical protein
MGRISSSPGDMPYLTSANACQGALLFFFEQNDEFEHRH